MSGYYNQYGYSQNSSSQQHSSPPLQHQYSLPPQQQQYYPPPVHHRYSQPLQHQQYHPPLQHQYSPPPLQQQYYPTPQQQQYSPSLQQQLQEYRRSPYIGVQTRIYGLVVGVSFDEQKDYLLYSKNFNDFIRISRSVQEIEVGKWFTIDVNCENYAGDFVLDNYNSENYTINSPHPYHVSTRFFPNRPNNPVIGELLVTARFSVRANKDTGFFEYISCVIDDNHLVDDYNLIKSSARSYEGRSFIVEMQASTNGFVVLKVHEDPNKQLQCNNLRDTVVPYNVRLLDETCLMTIMTGDGTVPGLENINNCHTQTSTNNYQNYENPSTSSRSPFEAASSMSSDTLADLRSASESELRALVSDSNDTRETTMVNSRSTVTRRHSVPTPPLASPEDSDEEDEETLITRGTKNLLRGEFIADVSQTALERCYTEKPLMQNKDPALCVVVLKMPNCAILYTVKKQVQNILVLDSCAGVTEPLRVGDVAFFEISDRRIETKDSILPEASYSHIAVRMKPITDKSRVEINRFKKSVRTFGGMLEMKVRIDLREKGNVEEYYDGDVKVRKSEEERKLYILRATNGARVTIPKARLVSWLTVSLTANFELVAWAVHRRSIGSCSLHIDRKGEAIQYGEEGACLLPLLSDDLMNVKK